MQNNLLRSVVELARGMALESGMNFQLDSSDMEVFFCTSHAALLYESKAKVLLGLSIYIVNNKFTSRQ